MINVAIDEFTPCIKDTRTGDILETEVIRIKRKSFLKKFNKKNGWYTNWEKLLDENEVYALVLKGSVDIQGLVAVADKKEYDAVYISWMCVAPENNELIVEQKKYSGVGGHLFAIAMDKSVQYGHEGAVTGFAANMELVKHYCNMFQAEHIAMLHEYQIFIDEENAAKVMEVYDYEWTDDEL